MTRNPHVFLAAAFFLFAEGITTQPSLADEAAIFADCSGGNGCTCAIAAISPTDVNLLLGIDGDPLPVVVQGPSGDFTTTEKHPDDVHQGFGGQGPCLISIDSLPVDVAKVIDGTAELLDPDLDGAEPAEVIDPGLPDLAEISPPPPASGLRPEDGLWALTPEPVEAIGQCNAQIMPEVTTLTSGFAHERPINWEGVFHPDRFLLAHTATPIDWQAAGPNRFEALVKSPKSEVIKVFYSAELLASDAAEISVELRLEGGPAIAGMANCRLRTIFHARRIG